MLDELIIPKIFCLFKDCLHFTSRKLILCGHISYVSHTSLTISCDKICTSMSSLVESAAEIIFYNKSYSSKFLICIHVMSSINIAQGQQLGTVGRTKQNLIGPFLYCAMYCCKPNSIHSRSDNA